MKNSTLSLTILTLAVALLSACGGGQKDPASQLAALKDQKAQLEAQIATLEKQVGNANTGTEKRVKTVALTEVKTSVFKHFIDLQGKVDADETVAATSRMPGTLSRRLRQKRR